MINDEVASLLPLFLFFHNSAQGVLEVIMVGMNLPKIAFKNIYFCNFVIGGTVVVVHWLVLPPHGKRVVGLIPGLGPFFVECPCPPHHPSPPCLVPPTVQKNM